MANQEMERALDLRRLRGEPRLGRRRPQRQARHRRSSPTPCAGSGRTGPRPSRPAPGSPQLQEILDPRRGLEARRRRLQVHRRPGRQRQGRGLLQRHPQQQDLQDRPRRQGEPLPRRLEAGPTARRSAPTAGSTRSPAGRARSSPTTPTASRRVIADGFRGNDLVVRHDGGIYVTNPEPRRAPSRARSGTSAPRARRRSSTPA